MTINGNGIKTNGGRQLLQIIPINIVTIVSVIGCAVGLYYKFEGRIAALEKLSASTVLADRVDDLRKKMDESREISIGTAKDVAWLVSERRGVPPSK